MGGLESLRWDSPAQLFGRDIEQSGIKTHCGQTRAIVGERHPAHIAIAKFWEFFRWVCCSRVENDRSGRSYLTGRLSIDGCNARTIRGDGQHTAQRVWKRAELLPARNVEYMHIARAVFRGQRASVARNGEYPNADSAHIDFPF